VEAMGVYPNPTPGAPLALIMIQSLEEDTAS